MISLMFTCTHIVKQHQVHQEKTEYIMFCRIQHSADGLFILSFCFGITTTYNNKYNCHDNQVV